MILPAVIEELIGEYSGKYLRLCDGHLKFVFEQDYSDEKRTKEVKVIAGLWSCAITLRAPIFDGYLYDLVLYRKDSQYTIPAFSVHKCYNRCWGNPQLNGHPITEYLQYFSYPNKDLRCDIDNIRIDAQGQSIAIPVTVIDLRASTYSHKVSEYIQKKLARTARSYDAPVTVSLDENMGIFYSITPRCSFDYLRLGSDTARPSFSVDEKGIVMSEDLKRHTIDIVEESTAALRAIYPYIRMLQTSTTGDFIDDPLCVWIRHLYEKIAKDERIAAGASYEILSESEFRVEESANG